MGNRLAKNGLPIRDPGQSATPAANVPTVSGAQNDCCCRPTGQRQISNADDRLNPTVAHTGAFRLKPVWSTGNSSIPRLPNNLQDSPSHPCKLANLPRAAASKNWPSQPLTERLRFEPYLLNHSKSHLKSAIYVQPQVSA